MSKKSLHAAVDKLTPGQTAILLVDYGGRDRRTGVHMFVPAKTEAVFRLLERAFKIIADEAENAPFDTEEYRA